MGDAGGSSLRSEVQTAARALMPSALTLLRTDTMVEDRLEGLPSRLTIRDREW